MKTLKFLLSLMFYIIATDYRTEGMFQFETAC